MNAFSDSPSPPSSPSYGSRRRRGIARRVERQCCNVLTYFPLVFVYGLTTWAVWVEVGIGMLPADNVWTGYGSSLLGVVFYVLTNWSYTTAVFTDPGSTLNTSSGYSHLPTAETPSSISLTVKSTGEMRYCKKCQAKKPDRAHHCSTCRRCVLKMDHHCPWLATCVGLRNYKPFLLFCIYISLFCLVCFAVSATWVWGHIYSGQFEDALMPINYILLAILSGIFGLVLTGFAGWHVWLASSGQTTIENLEKTRYLSPIKKHMEHQFESTRNYLPSGRPSLSQQLQEIHANALPGITRPEEGEERSSPVQSNASPAHSSLRRNFAEMEMQRERDRYQEYLDEQDSEKLPNAFDLGWKRNLTHIFGSSPFLWFIPICNTSGDGWYWEPSTAWLAARDRIARERQAQLRRQQELERAAGWGPDPAELPRAGSPYAAGRRATAKWDGREDGKGRYLTTSEGVATVPLSGRRSPGKADQILGRAPREYIDGTMTSAPTRRRSDPLGDLDDDEDEDQEYEDSSDEEPTVQKSMKYRTDGRAGRQKLVGQGLPRTKDWNDIPEDMLGRSSKAAGSGIERPNSRLEARSKKARGDGDEWDDWKPT